MRLHHAHFVGHLAHIVAIGLKAFLAHTQILKSGVFPLFLGTQILEAFLVGQMFLILRHKADQQRAHQNHHHNKCNHFGERLEDVHAVKYEVLPAKCETKLLKIVENSGAWLVFGADRSSRLRMSLYQEQLLALSKDLSHCGDPAACASRAFRRNPACGDEIALGFRREEDHIAGLCFQLRGCAVSHASAAVLARVIEGLALPAARERLACVQSFFHGDAEWTAEWGRDEMSALGALRARPRRMACVRLPWDALADALDTP